jgi:type II secretory pathway component PulF
MNAASSHRSGLSVLPTALQRRAGRFGRRLYDGFRRFRYFGLAERCEWYDTMETLVSSDVTTKDALQDLADQNQRFKRAAALPYREINNALATGVSIPLAAERWVTPLESIFLTAVDETKSPQAYGACAQLMNALQDIRTAMVKSMTYPTLLFFTMFFVMTLMADKYIPQVKEMKGFVNLSSDIHAFVALVDTLGHHPLAVAIALVVFVLLNILALDTWLGPSRNVADKYWPPFRIYRAYQASAMILCMAALMRARLTIDDALRAVNRHAGGYLRHHVEAILVLYRDGPDAAEAFDTGLLDHNILVRIASLSRTGGLASALETTGKSVLARGQAAILKASAIYFFVALGVVGAFLLYTVTLLNTVGQAAVQSVTQ